MKHLSYELPYMFNEYCVENDLKNAMALVEECFDYFPKEDDSITRVILEGLKESSTEEKHKNFFTYLLTHLNILYSSWLRLTS